MSDLCDDQFMHDNNYTNTYSLWGNSKYYDIKNLSPQNYSANRIGTIGSEIRQEFKASRWSSSPSEGQAPDPPDSRNRRTVEKESLYEDPDTFYKDMSEESPNRGPNFDWTQFYWHKATEKLQESMWDAGQGTSSKSKKPAGVGPNKIQKKIDKMLAKPVKMTKAESMMQKMGWQGGALGRTGDGIVEPIAPNAVYAKTKIGFGQNHIQLIKPPKNKKADAKQFFDMNILLNIYEFIKNNAEIELLFDKKLKKDERKRIHHLVEFKLKADDLASVDYDSTAQMDLILQINDINCYILNTLSSGAQSNRQLCLYKEAPPQVFLIVPDDLKDEEEEEVVTVEIVEPNKEAELEVQEQKVEETAKDIEAEIEEETNPFLISITRNLKKKTDSECQEDEEIEENPGVPAIPEVVETPVAALPEMSKILTRIVEYFTEFVEDTKYSEFKFLGLFTEEEISAINEFMEQAIKFLSHEGECRLAIIFEKIAFDINEDCTGNTVIYKRPV